jgi:hypothetical protein
MEAASSVDSGGREPGKILSQKEQQREQEDVLDSGVVKEGEEAPQNMEGGSVKNGEEVPQNLEENVFLANPHLMCTLNNPRLQLRGWSFRRVFAAARCYWR